MAEVITYHGEALIANKTGSSEILNADTFILSYDPELDPTQPIDRDTQLPPQSQIVYQDEVTQSGYVNPNQVVYSLFMDNDVGPFEFNRMDLVASEDDNTNIAIATFPTQNKIAEDPENGIRGQSMTRNFMTAYDGAQSVTGITVEAAVWQIDFMARLHASDDLLTKTNRDIYGRACFWGDSLKVVNEDESFKTLQGIAYVEGIRVYQQADNDLDPGILPKNVWLDISLQGNLNGVSAIVEPVYSTDGQNDYVDSNGIEHFFEKIAEISSSGVVTDTRNIILIDDNLVKYLERPVWKNIQQKPDEATRWPKFDEVTHKPSTYPPSSHTHEGTAFPGVVWMFSGTESQIEDGWKLCNGVGVTSNGIKVPNLMGRMIICAGGEYATGDTGGSRIVMTDSKGSHSHSVTVNSGGSHSHSVTVNSGGSHSHTITVDGRTLGTSQSPSHSHGARFDYCDVASGGSYGITAQGSRRPQGDKTVIVDRTGSSQSHNHTARSNSTGSHNHSASSNSTGSHNHSASSSSAGSHNHSVSTMSPYYVLAFIIKL